MKGLTAYTVAALLGSCVAALAITNGTVAGGPTFTTITFPGGLGNDANGINLTGQIVGDYIDTAGIEHGYLLSSGTFTSITFPGAIFTEAYGINDSGDIVGDYSLTDASGKTDLHAYLRRSGTFTSIDFPGVSLTTARGINSSRGDIAGFYLQGAGNTSHGFLLSGGTFTSIDFPGATLTEAWRVNDAGQILGRYKSPVDGKFHVYLLSNGSFTSIDFPGAIETASADISFGGLTDSGDIVSDYCNDVRCLEHFRFGKGNGNADGFLLSGAVFTTIDFPGAAATGSFGINDSGDIVGGYLDTSGGVHGYLRTP